MYKEVVGDIDDDDSQHDERHGSDSRQHFALWRSVLVLMLMERELARYRLCEFLHTHGGDGETNGGHVVLTRSSRKKELKCDVEASHRSVYSATASQSGRRWTRLAVDGSRRRMREDVGVVTDGTRHVSSMCV